MPKLQKLKNFTSFSEYLLVNTNTYNKFCDHLIAGCEPHRRFVRKPHALRGAREGMSFSFVFQHLHKR